MKKFSRGFTLIELLIVIALLGALAVGLLAALDPFEQLKKGADTGIRNTVSEIHGAVIRYYAIKNYMPWCTDPDTCNDPTSLPMSDADGTTIITAITQVGELKTDFRDIAGSGTLSKILITGSNTNATVSVCFKPTAKSFIADSNTKYTQSGVDGCAASDPTHNSCYWCVN